MLMNQTLDDLLGLAAQQAHLTLLGLKLPDLAPSWVFIQADKSKRVLITPFADDDQKEATIAYVKAWMHNHGTIAYSFLSEAWSAYLEPGEWDPESGPLPEADRPINRLNRKEIVMVLATDGKETKHRQWEIVRDWEGKICGLVPQEMAESQIAPEKSRFAGLLS